MRKLIVWTICCLALGLSACATTNLERRPTPDTANACAEWRWIGISQPGAQCPEAEGWTVRPMFPQLSPALPRSGESCGEPEFESYRRRLDAVRKLNRFCVYETRKPKETLRNLPLAAGAGLVRMDQDCAALSLTASELDHESPRPDPSDLLIQAGLPQRQTRPGNQPSVRLTFLDTQPDGDGVPTVPGRSMHGYTLANIAKSIVCDPENEDRCVARVATRLALPVIKFDAKDPKKNVIDRTWGGHFGMQGDLATAIVSEVQAWQENPQQQHLVLNLSMAWDGALFGGLSEAHLAEMRAGTQAVYSALQYAAESGALVLAAAGNQKETPCANYGPLLPAAWERNAPRDASSCREEERPPLLYAVGGLQSDDRPLDNARPGGMPRRAAHGQSWSFSGSSVATAVASSIAAFVWDAFPTMDAPTLMSILDESGPALFPADFWSGAGDPVPQAHKLMLCTALEKACERHDNESAICPVRCNAMALRGAVQAPAKTGKGLCQPWLSPQPEDTPNPRCTATGCQGM